MPRFLAAIALLFMAFALTPAMTPAIAQPNFTAMPQADNVAYMQQNKAMQQAMPQGITQDMIQGRASDFITQFETFRTQFETMPFLMPRPAPVAQVASVKQAAPAAQVAPAPQTQSVLQTQSVSQTQAVLQTQSALSMETDKPIKQTRIYRLFHALFDLLPLPKSTPAPIKPDTALGVRG